MLTVGSLFTGIGGFDLGLERAGMRVVWQCEQDAYCRRVLARHWPGVPCHPDVRALVADADDDQLHKPEGKNGTDDGGTITRRRTMGLGGGGERGAVPVSVPYVDVLAGGFPCQDLSVAGKGAGIDGARSGLWAEFARLIGELRPRYVLVENVPALLTRGFERVLADLAAVGYDAEWDCLPAAAFGAPHQRDRVWLVAYPGSDGVRDESGRRDRQNGSGPAVAGHDGAQGIVADAAGVRRETSEARRAAYASEPDSWWSVEPDVGRVAHGVPARVDRLRALGNSLVPQIAEWIGRRIVTCEKTTNPERSSR